MRLCGISSRFQLLSPCMRQVTHALLTRPPLSHHVNCPKTLSKVAPFDLHVLSTPPAFILSQDQTLVKIYSRSPGYDHSSGSKRLAFCIHLLYASALDALRFFLKLLKKFQGWFILFNCQCAAAVFFRDSLFILLPALPNVNIFFIFFSR